MSDTSPAPEVIARPPDFNQLEPRSNATPVSSLESLRDVPITITAKLGHAVLPISEILKLGAGAVVELEETVSQPVELMVRGVPFATGEVVVVDDHFAIRIKSLLPPRGEARSLMRFCLAWMITALAAGASRSGRSFLLAARHPRNAKSGRVVDASRVDNRRGPRHLCGRSLASSAIATSAGRTGRSKRPAETGGKSRRRPSVRDSYAQNRRPDNRGRGDRCHGPPIAHASVRIV